MSDEYYRITLKNVKKALKELRIWTFRDSPNEWVNVENINTIVKMIDDPIDDAESETEETSKNEEHEKPLDLTEGETYFNRVTEEKSVFLHMGESGCAVVGYPEDRGDGITWGVRPEDLIETGD